MFTLEQEDTKSKFIAALVFLFPVAGIGLRHWFSGFATLLVLIGIYILISNLIRKPSFLLDYSKYEKILLLLVASLFLSFLISGFANGWNDNQLDYFMGEMNFLFFIPMYIAIRNIKNTSELIIKGTVVSGVVLLIILIKDLYISPNPNDIRVAGAYGHLLAGPVSVIIMFVSLSAYNALSQDKYWKVLTLVSIVSSFIAALASKSGTAYSLLFLMCFIIPFIITKKTKSRVFVYVTLFLVLLISFVSSDRVKKGVLRVTDSAQLYYSLDDTSKYTKSLGTAGDRIALWGASWKIFKDNMIFGVGRGNYNMATQKYYKRGELHIVTMRHSHPHNIYFELLASKGLIGISVFLLLIFVIFRMYFLARKARLLYSEAALVHIFAILLIGIGSEAPILKNNFISIFLVYTAVFYSSFSQQLENKTMTNSSA